MKSLVAIGASILGMMAVGCTSRADSAISSSSNLSAQDDPDRLRDASVISGEVAVGKTTQVGYTPGDYTSSNTDGDADAWELPYLGWKVTSPVPAAGTQLPANAPRPAAPLSVHVSGRFPSSPEVVVVDGNFNVLASTRTHLAGGGLDVADLRIEDPRPDTFVLVRDSKWVLAMQFDISVSQ